MISKMTKYSWILLSSQKDEFLAALQKLGIIDITRSEKPVDEFSERLLCDIEKKKETIRNIKKGSDQKLASLKSEYDSIRSSLAEIKPWGEYDIEKLSAFDPHFHIVPSKSFDKEWENQAVLQKVCEKDGKVWFVTLGESNLPIKEIPAPTSTDIDLRSRAEEKRKEMDSYAESLEKRKADLPQLERELSDQINDLNVYLAKTTGALAAEERLTVFEGFAPTESDGFLEGEFDKMDVYWQKEAAKAEDNPPIELRNNRFVKMFEVLTDMYGRPNYDGFDPTPYISIFFLLFFAMCMGDLGYGIVLTAAGCLLKKSKSFAKLAPLSVTLGIATIVAGFFFHTFFSIDIKTLSFIPQGVKAVMLPDTIAGYDGTMVCAIAVGIVHLLLAMTVKTVYATRNQGFTNSLSIWGWTLFWVGLTVTGLISLIGVIDAEITRWAIITIGIISAIGIFPLNKPGRNPLVNIGSGLWDTYNMATGILGDVLSYLRLYALGLAGAKLGFAFNELAGLALGDGGAGWIFFCLIAIVGHVLNLAMAVLGAFVHPLRLNFLEFFKNSDYKGTGRKYQPLKNN